MVASLLMAAYFIEGRIAREITGTLVFDCDENYVFIAASDSCLEELPLKGYIGLVDLTGKPLYSDETLYSHLRRYRTIAEGAVTGTDRTSPVPFSIEFYYKDIDRDGDYIILVDFSYSEWDGPSVRVADYLNSFSNDPPRVLTNGYPSKDIVVPLTVRDRSIYIIS